MVDSLDFLVEMSYISIVIEMRDKYIMKNLKNTKSQLAKLMATENVTVQHQNVPTASFDVKNRVLTLPNLDDGLTVNLYDLMTSLIYE